jgi:hypothetical protein
MPELGRVIQPPIKSFCRVAARDFAEPGCNRLDRDRSNLRIEPIIDGGIATDLDHMCRPCCVSRKRAPRTHLWPSLVRANFIIAHRFSQKTAEIGAFAQSWDDRGSADRRKFAHGYNAFWLEIERLPANLGNARMLSNEGTLVGGRDSS